MEPVRPQVDSLLLDWITREPLTRAWFVEQRNGNCRLTSTLAIELSQTARTWGRAVAPFTEWVARLLWSSSTKSGNRLAPPTLLTQRHKREAKGAQPLPRLGSSPTVPRLCRGCGKSIRPEHVHCAVCAAEGAKERMIQVAKVGRLVSHNPEARARQSATRGRHARACSEWVCSARSPYAHNKVQLSRVTLT